MEAMRKKPRATKRLLKALDGSIKHWEKNAAAVKFEDASVDWEDCPLCLQFYNNGCRGCPVAWKAGDDSCQGTPYELAAIAHDQWKERRWPSDNARQFTTAAKLELRFLKELREELTAKETDAQTAPPAVA